MLYKRDKALLAGNFNILKKCPKSLGRQLAIDVRYNGDLFSRE